MNWSTGELATHLKGASHDDHHPRARPFPLYAARTAIEEARATFAADSTTGDRLDWLYATATELRGLAERISEVLR